MDRGVPGFRVFLLLLCLMRHFSCVRLTLLRKLECRRRFDGDLGAQQRYRQSLWFRASGVWGLRVWNSAHRLDKPQMRKGSLLPSPRIMEPPIISAGSTKELNKRPVA